MWENEVETEMRRDRPYVSGDCGTLLAVCTSRAKNCWQLKLLPKTPRIMEVWFIFISISFYLVSTLSLLEMKYWAISGEIILRRSLTCLGIMGLVIKDKVMLMGSHLARMRCVVSWSLIAGRYLCQFKNLGAGWNLIHV